MLSVHFISSFIILYFASAAEVSSPRHYFFESQGIFLNGQPDVNIILQINPPPAVTRTMGNPDVSAIRAILVKFFTGRANLIACRSKDPTSVRICIAAMPIQYHGGPEFTCTQPGCQTFIGPLIALTPGEMVDLIFMPESRKVLSVGVAWSRLNVCFMPPFMFSHGTGWTCTMFMRFMPLLDTYLLMANFSASASFDALKGLTGAAMDPQTILGALGRKRRSIPDPECPTHDTCTKHPPIEDSDSAVLNPEQWLGTNPDFLGKPYCKKCLSSQELCRLCNIGFDTCNNYFLSLVDWYATCDIIMIHLLNAHKPINKRYRRRRDSGAAQNANTALARSGEAQRDVAALSNAVDRMADIQAAQQSQVVRLGNELAVSVKAQQDVNEAFNNKIDTLANLTFDSIKSINGKLWMVSDSLAEIWDVTAESEKFKVIETTLETGVMAIIVEGQAAFFEMMKDMFDNAVFSSGIQSLVTGSVPASLVRPSMLAEALTNPQVKQFIAEVQGAPLFTEEFIKHLYTDDSTVAIINIDTRRVYLAIKIPIVTIASRMLFFKGLCLRAQFGNPDSSLYATMRCPFQETSYFALSENKRLYTDVTEALPTCVHASYSYCRTPSLMKSPIKKPINAYSCMVANLFISNESPIEFDMNFCVKNWEMALPSPNVVQFSNTTVIGTFKEQMVIVSCIQPVREYRLNSSDLVLITLPSVCRMTGEDFILPGLPLTQNVTIPVNITYAKYQSPSLDDVKKSLVAGTPADFSTQMLIISSTMQSELRNISRYDDQLLSQAQAAYSRASSQENIAARVILENLNRTETLNRESTVLLAKSNKLSDDSSGLQYQVNKNKEWGDTRGQATGIAGTALAVLAIVCVALLVVIYCVCKR